MSGPRDGACLLLSFLFSFSFSCLLLASVLSDLSPSPFGPLLLYIENSFSFCSGGWHWCCLKLLFVPCSFLFLFPLGWPRARPLAYFWGLDSLFPHQKTFLQFEIEQRHQLSTCLHPNSRRTMMSQASSSAGRTQPTPSACLFGSISNRSQPPQCGLAQELRYRVGILDRPPVQQHVHQPVQPLCETEAPLPLPLSLPLAADSR